MTRWQKMTDRELLEDIAQSLHSIDGTLQDVSSAFVGGLAGFIDSYRNKRVARHKRGSGGSHTQAEWKELKAAYEYRCIRCKRQEPEIKLTRDHIIPLDKGGTNDISNIQPLCKDCNEAKDNETTDYRANDGS